MTKGSVEQIRQSNTLPTLFAQAVSMAMKEVDAEIELGPVVPIPRDMAGGYTHERHKRNFFILQKAGNLYQITGEEKYARYVKDVLMAYARIYPTLDIHPTKRSYATGRIFWQCLNDANWLVYVSQAYDCIYEWLSTEERQHLETDLFRPFADFLSTGNPQFFNRIHNHSTWGNAAVGMIGFVMQDQELIDRALYGLDQDDIAVGEKDNDGGLIKMPGQKQAGFFAQLDHAFSPDGYYTEGPYYHRYAIFPFILFAKAIQNHRPDLGIFEYRGQLLKKSIYALLFQTDTNGNFFPFNDAQKGMSYHSRELIAAVDIVYAHFADDPSLLSIVDEQGAVQLNGAGFLAAQHIDAGKVMPFIKPSIELRDGGDGTEGCIGILRSIHGTEETALVMKYSAHGLSHGHYDKLSFSLYHNATEIVQDYGMARWVNIDQKNGGRYLPENTSWAKQTVAHNTIIVDETSQFGGDYEMSDAHHAERYWFDTSGPAVQVMSAKEANAYPGVQMHRTMAMIEDSTYAYPLILDIYRLESDASHQYDLPYYFTGHMLSTNIDYTAKTDALNVLGADHGFQHLWLEAQGTRGSENPQVTWFDDFVFSTVTFSQDDLDQFLFVRLGANDPDFNLRRDHGLIVRRPNAKNSVFVSVTEIHGKYSPVAEVPINPFNRISGIEVIHNDREFTIVEMTDHQGNAWTIMQANQDASEGSLHEITVNGVDFMWNGPFEINKLQSQKKSQ